MSTRKSAARVKVKRPEAAPAPTPKAPLWRRAVAIALVALVALSGLGTGVYYLLASDDTVDYELTGGVAATVGDVEILEDDVTAEVMEFRESWGYSDDDDWAAYLYDYGYTVESYRASVIDDLVEDAVLAAAYEDLGIEVSDEDVEAAWEEAVESYGDEDTFLTILETYFGYTEESYKEFLAEDLLYDVLYDTVAPERDADDDEVLAILNADASGYSGRRSTNLLVYVDDTDNEDELAYAYELASEAIAAVESGEMTFDEAVEAYGTTSDCGDVGWDCLTSLADEYQEALDALSVGEWTTEPVLSSYGYHVILCTDLYEVPDTGETDVANVPDDIYDTIAEEVVATQQAEDWDAWYDDFYDSLGITVSDMPDGLAYWVDLDAYEATLEEADE